MTSGLTEFKTQGLPPKERGLDLAVNILDAIENGSTVTSPWLHFSKDYHEAYKWKSRGAELRGEKDTLVCRVNIASLEALAASHGRKGPVNLDDGLKVGQVVDLSSTECTKPWLNKYALEEAIQQRLSTLRRSHASKEVAVCWRGHIASSFFEVLDEFGKFKHFLHERRFLVTCTHMYSSHMTCFHMYSSHMYSSHM